jgi:uncharacterized membrane protein
MTMRLHEVHPSVVHFPITLFPVSLGMDLAGRVSGDGHLLEAGRLGMIGAATSAALAGIFGFIAQEEIVAGDARDILVTHRTMNIGFLALASTMAAVRARRERPTWSYLAAGIIGTAGLLYSAYLGGKMVYTHGVGVEKAAGLDHAEAPELVPSEAGRVARKSLQHAARGVWHTVQDMADGEIVPALRPSPPRRVATGEPLPTD